MSYLTTIGLFLLFIAICGVVIHRLICLARNAVANGLIDGLYKGPME